jgi:anti-sigma B factor antagonist
MGDRITVKVESCRGAITIVVGGELDLATMPVLAELLALVSREEPRQLVFDLAGTHFMDCGSARLIASTGGWLPAGQRPVIRHPGARIRRILELTGLDAYCEIEELAVGSNRAWRLARASAPAREPSGAGR